MLGHKLLVSDLDGTLLGNCRDLARFAAWHGRYRSQVRLVYASGNSCELIAKLVRDASLPRPHAIIGSVGTELQLFPSGRPFCSWEERLRECWDEKLVRATLRVCDWLEPQPDDVILEVGTGSGYQAAVLAHLVKHVYTIEILQALADSARQRLEKLGYDNVTVRCGDGYQGWPEHAPFDAIIVTCAPEEIPQPLHDQLGEAARMVIPVGPAAGIQHLYLLEKRHGELTRTAVLPVRFVPMTGEAQQQ